jgi:hypothetical protein
MDGEALVTKAKMCRSGGCVVKADVLTRGDLVLGLKGPRRIEHRSEKLAEAIVGR